MKDLIIAFAIGLIFSLVILTYIENNTENNTENNVENKSTISRYTQITKVTLMTKDAVQLKGTCMWCLDTPSIDVDRSKIDLIINRTIQKSMAKYSYEDWLNYGMSIFKDTQEKIEDYVFSIQPYRFTICNLSMNKI